MSPYTNDELRAALGQPHLTDEEIEEFQTSLQAWLRTFLDDFFRDAYPDDCEMVHPGS